MVRAPLPLPPVYVRSHSLLSLRGRCTLGISLVLFVCFPTGVWKLIFIYVFCVGIGVTLNNLTLIQVDNQLTSELQTLHLAAARTGGSSDSYSPSTGVNRVGLYTRFNIYLLKNTIKLIKLTT